MQPLELEVEIQLGSRLVMYQWCISVVVLTFKRTSRVMLIRPGESRFRRGLPWTLLTLVGGWWGIPWGPIFTIESIVKNSRGGIDVTDDVRAAIRGTMLTEPEASPEPPPVTYWESYARRGNR
jgi:hypothetical protein